MIDQENFNSFLILDAIFRNLDKLVKANIITKIETYGKRYICVAGLKSGKEADIRPENLILRMLSLAFEI